MTKSKRPTTLVIAAVLALAPLPGLASQLTAQEFMSTHAGKCISYQGPTSGVECYNADGTASYDDSSYGKDTGTWGLRGNEVCMTWKGSPGLDCGPVTRVNATTFTDGSYTWVVN